MTRIRIKISFPKKTHTRSSQVIRAIYQPADSPLQLICSEITGHFVETFCPVIHHSFLSFWKYKWSPLDQWDPSFWKGGSTWIHQFRTCRATPCNILTCRQLEHLRVLKKNEVNLVYLSWPFRINTPNNTIFKTKFWCAVSGGRSVTPGKNYRKNNEPGQDDFGWTSFILSKSSGAVCALIELVRAAWKPPIIVSISFRFSLRLTLSLFFC